MRFYEIDGLRFIAAAMVVMFHFTFRGYAADDLSPVPFETLGTITRYGYLGVDLFFIISGFVILMTARYGDPVRFVISRMVRIYPAFWFSVSLTALVMWLYAKPPFLLEVKTYFLNLPLVLNFLDVPNVDSVYWSLLVELKFYFLVFVVLVLGQIQRIFWYLLGWLTLSILIEAFQISGAPRFFLFPEWSHYFIAGSLFYVIRVDGPSMLRCAPLGVCFLFSCYQVFAATPPSNADVDTLLSPLVICSVIAVFYLVFLAIALGKTAWIDYPWLLTIGALTYPLYLVHQNIGFIVINVLAEHMNKYLLLIFVILLALCLSWIINRVVEEKFGRLLKQFLQYLVNTFKSKMLRSAP